MAHFRREGAILSSLGDTFSVAALEVAMRQIASNGGGVSFGDSISFTHHPDRYVVCSRRT